MKIAGFQKNSFVDYRGKVAAVIFTPGCNMDCFYCHNRGILAADVHSCMFEPEEVLRVLAERVRFLDGVVISGGEPTLQPDLMDFIKEIKKLKYPVKIDTNGTNPGILEKLIDLRLADFIAMDVKAPFDRYEEICGAAVNINNIEKSIDILMEERVEYEFRTTVVPELAEEDILRIAERLKGARLYILQQFRQPAAYNDLVDYRALKPPYSSAFIKSMTAKVSGFVRQYETRGII